MGFSTGNAVMPCRCSMVPMRHKTSMRSANVLGLLDRSCLEIGSRGSGIRSRTRVPQRCFARSTPCATPIQMGKSVAQREPPWKRVRHVCSILRLIPITSLRIPAVSSVATRSSCSFDSPVPACSGHRPVHPSLALRISACHDRWEKAMTSADTSRRTRRLEHRRTHQRQRSERVVRSLQLLRCRSTPAPVLASPQTATSARPSATHPWRTSLLAKQ
jgi:hypothetical protein